VFLVFMVDYNIKNTIIHDSIIATEFLPKIGGAHMWLYEVYSRWPSPVGAFVQDYSHNENWMNSQRAFDLKKHGSLEIWRTDLGLGHWSLCSFQGFRTWQLINACILNWRKSGGERLHCVKAVPEAAFALLNPFHKTKIIVYAHGEEFLVAKASNELSWLTRFALKQADLVIANSQSTVELVKEFAPNTLAEVIHPGVDVNDFQKSESNRQEMRNKWQVDDDTVVLLTMARQEERKNQLGVLQALTKLNYRKSDILYVIGSDGPERGKLEEYVRENDLEDIVLFTGYLSDQERKDSFAAADIHVMPSVQRGAMIEGFGIVFIEAAAVGIPSIAGEVGGQAEAVIDGKTGLVVDGDNQAQLQAALQSLISNSDLRKQMGEAGRYWAAENDWDRIAKKTYDLVMSLG
jgi:phosphatidylinositol alpha-1,6-mannosyltransferase